MPRSATLDSGVHRECPLPPAPVPVTQVLLVGSFLDVSSLPVLSVAPCAKAQWWAQAFCSETEWSRPIALLLLEGTEIVGQKKKKWKNGVQGLAVRTILSNPSSSLKDTEVVVSPKEESHTTWLFAPRRRLDSRAKL